MSKQLNKQLSKQTIKFDNPPRWAAGYSIVGPKESGGPMSKYFDYILKSDSFSEKTYEKAERKMLEHAITGAATKAGLLSTDIDLLISGDLLNQIITSSFSARQLQSGFLGLFGACSNMTESLIVGAALVDGGFINTAACATSSHFSSAERQFRFPLELGSPRPPTSQWTVTAAGCSIIKKGGTGHKITHATIGKVIDFGVNDINNMGAAMAPAAADTLQKVFEDTKTTPQDYDLIISGDLGKLGSELLIDLLEIKGYKIGANYADCGQAIFSNTQRVFMGGSGCGCSASVYNSYVYNKLTDRSYKKVILMSTGALMSPTSVQQGETIPAIAHAVIVEADEGGK
ncbi:MAG: stage V sporulation protein AD [Christensenellaceae bacterium]|jgi:stage V sporulation protein AD|nr:stage V sporulation protein AD [Christensenellaceae bacterium]